MLSLVVFAALLPGEASSETDRWIFFVGLGVLFSVLVGFLWWSRAVKK